MNRLDEFGLAGLAELKSHTDAHAEIWVLRFLSEELEALKVRVVLPVTKMLDDVRVASSGDASSGLRVCDHAYSFLRRFMLGEDSSDFLTGSIRDRDRLIRNLKKSDELRIWLDGTL